MPASLMEMPVHTVKISGKPEDDGIVGKDAPDKPEIGQNQRGGMDKFPEDIHLAHLDLDLLVPDLSVLTSSTVL